LSTISIISLLYVPCHIIIYWIEFLERLYCIRHIHNCFWTLRSLNVAFPCWSCLSYFTVLIPSCIAYRFVNDTTNDYGHGQNEFWSKYVNAEDGNVMVKQVTWADLKVRNRRLGDYTWIFGLKLLKNKEMALQNK
jgi:hypothetical protein